MNTSSSAYSLVANHHLHIIFDHEILVVRRQRFRSRVVPATSQRQLVLYITGSPKRAIQHEFGKILIVLENKCANCIVVHHLRLPSQHIAHDRSIALEAVCLHTRITHVLSLKSSKILRQDGMAYKTVRDHIMLLQHRRSHLSVHVIVMFDERLIAHPRLLPHEDGRFDDFSEACC